MQTYYCKKISTNLNIDGNIQKKEWELAEKISLRENVTGKRPRQSTDVKMLWNNEYLYVAFQCQDDFINASYQGFNDKLYDEEVVELFLDDDRDLKTYLEFEVNPLNAVLHYSIHNNLQDEFLKFARLEKNIITAVFQDQAAQIWNAELAIPFTEFVTAPNNPPRSQDKWLMNLYRIDRPQNGNDEYSAWLPTGQLKFHLPQFFGELIFSE